MLDELRDRIVAYLLRHPVGVLVAAGAPGISALPVRCHSHDLQVDCLVPRWADVAYRLEQDRRVALIISDPPLSPLLGGTRGGLCWLQYQGIAHAVAAPNWTELLPVWTSAAPPENLYVVIRVTPQRIDLFDESNGWGARETLEV